MGPLDKFILSENALKATKTGFELAFQSHWYRSLPLSCIDFNLKINSECIDNESVMIVVNDKTYSYSQMCSLDNEWLFILDKAIIIVPKALNTGENYTVGFTLNLYIPYILVGPESQPLMAGTYVEKTLTCL